MGFKFLYRLFVLSILLCCVRLTFAQSAANDCQPGISFGSLLGSVQIGYADGRLQIEKLYAVCLPMPGKQSDSMYPYDPDSGGRLSMSVKSADGKTVNTYVWRAERFTNLWEMSQYKVVGGYQAIKPLGEGQYVLEFAAGDTPFYKFPFSIVAAQSTDPYQPPGKRYFIEGAWNEYGNLFYQRNDPQSSLSFTTWVREKTGKDGARSVPYEVKLIRSKDRKVLAVDSATLRLEPRWRKAEFLFRPTDGDGNSYFKAGELLREDGEYRLQLTMDGKPYGEYTVVVAGGKLQFQGRQVRPGTDPMLRIVDYIYGGKYSSWWVKREGIAK